MYEQRKFGNMLRTWATLDEFFASSYTGSVSLRYKGNHGGGFAAYGVSRDEVESKIAQWISEGAVPSLIKINESAPDDEILFQGEVMRSPNYLSMRYSTLKEGMRTALYTKQSHVEGLQAVMLLKTSIDPASWDEFQDLLEIYDDAVVEFSIWNVDIGMVPRRNTIFWEVRHY